MITYINELHENGTLKKLAATGFLSTKVFLFRNAYMEYDKLKRIGTPTAKAVFETAEKFDVTEAYVYTIIKTMKDE